MALFPERHFFNAVNVSKSFLYISVSIIFVCALLFPPFLFTQNLPLQLLQSPPGFKVQIFAYVPEARQLAITKSGTVFVGTKTDKVYALIPSDNLKRAKYIKLLATGLNGPNGVAIKDNVLYVSEINRLWRDRKIVEALEKNRENFSTIRELAITPEIVSTTLPNYSHHGLRYIKFGPDGKLYISIGAPCNSCLPDEKLLGTIATVTDGGQLDVFASGIRNSMGFDWDPQDNSLWFTDNGRDWLGDDEPPDELNHAVSSGLNFGFPFYNGFELDPKFGRLLNKDQTYSFPAYGFKAHSATLGMTFYRGTQFPMAYQKQLFVAMHGSWNRSSKVGYQIALVQFSPGRKTTQVTPFLSGWLTAGKVWGRPVDVAVMPDGALLVSDDYAGVIYRVSYSEEKPE